MAEIDIKRAKIECAKLQENFNAGITLPIYYRLNQLKALLALVTENEDKIVEALLGAFKNNHFLL